jgi:hypothetical protein
MVWVDSCSWTEAAGLAKQLNLALSKILRRSSEEKAMEMECDSFDFRPA